MRILLIALIALNFISGKNPTPAQTQMRDTNAKIKAVFLYNFTKYIEWPEGKREGNFVIGVLGQSPVFSELANSAHKNTEKPSAVRYLDIKSCNDVNSIAECHMLYIPNGSSEMLKMAVDKSEGHNTLIVTDKAGLAKLGGADINFVVSNNKVKFELNKSNVQKHELKVSNLLTNLAILVN